MDQHKKWIKKHPDPNCPKCLGQGYKIIPDSGVGKAWLCDCHKSADTSPQSRAAAEAERKATEAENKMKRRDDS